VRTHPRVQAVLQRVQYNHPVPELIAITEEMRVGVRPPQYARNSNATAAGPGALVMLHGYCAGANPWPTTDFTTANFFNDPNANRDTDTFALMVMAFAQNIPLFSGIGHSQGGHVLLHMHNFYWSGLEAADPSKGYIIQTVGTPYQGCSGAGTGASLMAMFGTGCGANDDLTTDGSQLWLANVLTEHRKNVYYHTTSYKLGSFFGDYCSLAVNFVLQWPNDGVAELDLARLDKGNYMGNTEKWCHTTDMGYPAQYTDHSRNQQMNSKAARS